MKANLICLIALIIFVGACEARRSRHREPHKIALGIVVRTFPQYDDPIYYNDEDHPERAYGHQVREHTTIFEDASSETKNNQYRKDITGHTLPRLGRAQTEIEQARAATKPVRVYKANNERLVPPKEGLPFEQPDYDPAVPGKHRGNKRHRRQ